MLPIVDPNSRQVGGEHYRVQYQHWDFAADARLGYFEGQATKYTDRHRSKKGREDVEKALHFVEKLITLARAGFTPMHSRLTDDMLDRFLGQRERNTHEVMAIRRVAAWSNIHDLADARFHLTQILADYDIADEPEVPQVDEPQQPADGGVLDGTNRTTSGVIGQP